MGPRSAGQRIVNPQFPQKGDIVENSDAMRGTDFLDGFVAEVFIQGAKNIGFAGNGGLQNRVVVRIAHNGRKLHR